MCLTHFSDLGLEQPILDALSSANYSTPTPIQAEAIPLILTGRDLLGIAATGTGKTAAFALPILQSLSATKTAPPRRGCRALVLAPTRELAMQIAESFRTYGDRLKLRVGVIVGGMPYRPQTQRLAKGVDVLVATPGRLRDHVNQGTARLNFVTNLVLDEADHMLDLGFIPDVRKLMALMPEERQNLLFSATMPKQIRTLANDFLRDPATVSISPAATPAERIEQKLIHTDHRRKHSLLKDILHSGEHGRVLVFTRTKHGADRVVRGLQKSGISAAAIHGNKSQNQRTHALEGFRSGLTPVLVATDIAARGVDIDDINLVVNYDLPNVAETYVHRIGRTARAGAEGAAIAFCGADDRQSLRGIEKLMKMKIPTISDSWLQPASNDTEPLPVKTPSSPGNSQNVESAAAEPAQPKPKRAKKKTKMTKRKSGVAKASQSADGVASTRARPKKKWHRGQGPAKNRAHTEAAGVGADAEKRADTDTSGERPLKRRRSKRRNHAKTERSGDLAIAV